MTHIIGGYPTMAECEKIALTMADSGAAFIEIQIPFSDPVADGTTIMAACQQSLEQGTTPKDCFELMKKLKEKENMPPLLFMSYYNILFKYGVEKFCNDAAEIGCYGLIVPDIPLDEEEYEHYLENCKKYGLKAIQVISPITPESRLEKIGQVAEGFVYCVSRTGTTGVQAELAPELSEFIARVKKYVDVPVAVGFGISSRDHVDAVMEQAEIAVVGSKVINLYGKAKPGEKLEAVAEFLKKVIV